MHAFVDDSYLVEEGLRNYWGYNSLAFFAPEPRYLQTGSATEFKVVNRFHSTGIEVILDVVYNRTAEGNELGPTLSFKGIDNASYYRLMPFDEGGGFLDARTRNNVNEPQQTRSKSNKNTAKSTSPTIILPLITAWLKV